MKPGKADVVRRCVFLLSLLAAVPAYCQRGTLDLNVGEIKDQFGAVPSVTGSAVDIKGEVIIIKASEKKGGANIVGGGDVRVPLDTNHHAKELAVYGGVMWDVHNFSIGVDAEVRRLYTPPVSVGGQTIDLDRLETLTLPLVIKYKFGPEKRAFLEVHGAPEFTPWYKMSKLATVALPKPGFDHGYVLGGSVGYNFGKWWYLKGAYEARYFKFLDTPGNPNGVYNWKSNLATGGVGVRF